MHEIVNARTGQTMRFLLRAAETDGELLRIETVNPPTGIFEPLHIHPHQETSAEVRAGALRFVVGGRERCVGPGEKITIPAGVPHHFASDGDVAAVAIQEARPALRLAEFFETYFDLAQRGELDEHGKPSILRFAALGPQFASEMRLAQPPWRVQQALFALLGPFARRRFAEA